MESQESLIHSIADADIDDSENKTVEPVVPPELKSTFFMLEPAILLLFFAWSVTSKFFSIKIHSVSAPKFQIFSTHHGTNNGKISALK